MASLLLSLQLMAQHSDYPFENGESIKYIVSYKIAFINVDIALATIDVTIDTVEGSEYYKVVCRAETAPAYKSFFDLNDVYTVWLDTQTLLPTKLLNDNKQGDYTSHSEYYYNWDKKEVRTIYYNINKPEQVEKIYPLRESSRDAISAFMYLRTLPFEHFLAADKEALDLVFHDKIRPVSYSHIESQEDRVRGHGKQLIHKFSCTLATSDGTGLDEGNEFELWFTDDQRQNKVPIFFYSPIRVGSVRARLATPSELERFYK